MQKDTRFGGTKHINCGFLSEETWRIIKLWCSHEKGGQIFFPSCLYGMYLHCYCTARRFSLYLEDKTAWASFCSKGGTLTKYTDWKERVVLKSTWGNKLIMADWVLNIYNTASSSSLWATCLPSLLNLYTLTGHSSEKSYVHNIRYAWNTGRL